MDITIANLPDMKNDTDQSILHSRIMNAVRDLLIEQYHIKKPEATLILGKSPSPPVQPSNPADEPEEEKDASVLPLKEPQFTFDQLILEDSILDELRYAIQFESVREKVYTQWGLEKLDPNPKLALNFWGDSGTGKTMAAHAIASVMGKKIILASYAEIESKYHGDGPKNVKKLFNFAAESGAVLFIDEADSLLSKRLTNVTQGSEQAINSMRSQLLIQIEQFSGVVIFATNLASNYDNAFVTRIKSIQFKKPDQPLRRKMWDKMLLPSLPLGSIEYEELAAIEDVCGRDIKNAIVKAAIKTAIDQEAAITQEVIEESIRGIIESNRKVTGSLSKDEKENIEGRIKRQLHKDKIQKRRLYRR